jgi:dTDP-4-dehydrorhamnose reductase
VKDSQRYGVLEFAPTGNPVRLEEKPKAPKSNYNELDLSNFTALREIVRSIEPQLIVNAAYTAVDKAESEPELAIGINGTAPGIFAGGSKVRCHINSLFNGLCI